MCKRSSTATDMQVLVFGKHGFFLLFLFVWKGNNHTFGEGTQTKKIVILINTLLPS